MRFGSNVVAFDLCGIPAVGNLDNGAVAGLTPEGAQLCQRLFEEDVAEEEARRIDPTLAQWLIDSEFFAEPRETAPLTLAYLHVTQRCNLSCAGCYSEDDARNNCEDAPTDAMLRAIDELAEGGVNVLTISGGETFLRPDLPQLLQRAKEAGIGTVTVITNGTCTSDEALAALAPWADAIAVSFDGWSAQCPAHIRGEQRFHLLCDTVHRIQAAGISAHITPTIHGKNAGDMARYVQLARELGATMNYSLLSCESSDALAPLLPSDEALRSLAQSLLAQGSMPKSSGGPVPFSLFAATSCGAGVKELSVAADGAVYPCHMLMQPQFHLGNIFEEPLETIRQRALEMGFSQLTVDEFDGCRDCGHRYLCGGGCRARALFAHGSLREPDGYCELMRTYYDQLGASLKQQFA
ncbi:radical SAM/SPASM domain-containing protein [Parvibacter caecicola]|uniref:radical SAM/SPASM domain-containing protein n=1 Tax=Parvibacter caecicola TaxID=747645 RepID=UPI00249C25B5|nr:radical SAM protein [Parvibacter caecicola]